MAGMADLSLVIELGEGITSDAPCEALDRLCGAAGDDAVSHALQSLRGDEWFEVLHTALAKPCEGACLAKCVAALAALFAQRVLPSRWDPRIFGGLLRHCERIEPDDGLFHATVDLCVIFHRASPKCVRDGVPGIFSACSPSFFYSRFSARPKRTQELILVLTAAYHPALSGLAFAPHLAEVWAAVRPGPEGDAVQASALGLLPPFLRETAAPVRSPSFAAELFEVLCQATTASELRSAAEAAVWHCGLLRQFSAYFRLLRAGLASA
jgi:hypothetical protein